MPAHQPVPEDNWRHLLADFPPSRRRCVNSFLMLLVAGQWYFIISPLQMTSCRSTCASLIFLSQIILHTIKCFLEAVYFFSRPPCLIKATQQIVTFMFPPWSNERSIRRQIDSQHLLSNKTITLVPGGAAALGRKSAMLNLKKCTRPDEQKKEWTINGGHATV